MLSFHYAKISKLLFAQLIDINLQILIYLSNFSAKMRKNSDVLIRRILRKSEGLGLKLCQSRIDSDALQSYGWAEVSDGKTTIIVELSENGKLYFYRCIKHILSNEKILAKSSM